MPQKYTNDDRRLLRNKPSVRRFLIRLNRLQWAGHVWRAEKGCLILRWSTENKLTEKRARDRRRKSRYNTTVNDLKKNQCVAEHENDVRQREMKERCTRNGRI